MSKYAKEFFIALNMQNPPNPAPLNWYVRVADDASIPEFTVAGFEFTKDLRKDSLGVAEGSDTEMNFRKCFLPEHNHTLVSRDFSGQELRILANLSGEQSWIDTFLQGGDIHESTARAVWGDKNYSPKRRADAKSINFGLAYGMGAFALAEKIGATEEEAQKHIDKFFETHPNIERYLQRQARLAERDKSLSNHYGRKRRYNNQFNMWGKLTGSGTRQAYNFPIQSMGADITKLGLLNVYVHILDNPKYRDKALWMSTIHDEINLSVSNDVLEEVTYLMGEVMQHDMLGGMPVPITTDIALGNSMGVIWSFTQDPETLKLTPIYKPLSKEDVATQQIL